ncbi:MAG: tyrosine-type recombinase/integrase [Terriglobales bacterium]
MTTRYQGGSVTLDPRTHVWYFRWRDDGGKRRAFRIGSTREYRTKTQAILAAEHMRQRINAPAEVPRPVVTVLAVANRYVAEKLPPHFSTADDYKRILNSRILPRWGETAITDIRPAPVAEWLDGLALAPKTKQNIKSVLGILIEQAMFWEYLKCERNPMQLVKIRGCSVRQNEPRVLTVAEFHQLVAEIPGEPFRTMLMFDMCLGLRFSELIALKWSDFDWKNLKVNIRLGAVRQRVGEVKTGRSRKPLPMDQQLAEFMLVWYRVTLFASPHDWVWASPYRNGKQPYAYSKLYDALVKAAESAGLGVIGWHTMRHTYRSWLDDTGAPMTVQQNLMRHASIATTMNVYGDAIPETLRAAHGKVVRMALQSASGL